MKKRTIAIAAAVAVLSAAVLIVSQTSVAYLMDTEAADNIIQIGQVSVELKEESFPTSEQTVEAGRKINKNPKLSNNGRNDEYVFLKVEVPKEKVTLLYESTVADGTATHEEGTKIGKQKECEIFKMLVDNDGTLIKQNDPEFVFNYHAGNSTSSQKKPGWIYLNTLTVTNGNEKNVYYFGYNKKLKVGEETVTLFDKVQLKSFIDGEVAGNTTNVNEKEETVKVTAYAIQADDLGLDGVTGAENEYLDEAMLGKIWTVVSNKSMTTG